MEDDVVKYNGLPEDKSSQDENKSSSIQNWISIVVSTSPPSSIRPRARKKKRILQQNGPFQPQTIVINPHSIETVDRIIYLELAANDHVPYELLFNINETRC